MRGLGKVVAGHGADAGRECQRLASGEKNCLTFSFTLIGTKILPNDGLVARTIRRMDGSLSRPDA